MAAQSARPGIDPIPPRTLSLGVRFLLAGLLIVGCVPAAVTPVPGSKADVEAIVRDARDLADDSLRGRGPWTRESERVARYLAARLERLGAWPVVGGRILVPFVSDKHPRDTVYNVAALLPSRSGTVSGRKVGITAHFDLLGVGAPDASGDSIYNGFLDDAIGVAMTLDVARRYRESPGERPLLVMFFDLEEQGLLGSKAFVERADARAVLSRLDLLIGVDAGSPAGEALDWQLMGGSPEHAGTRLADSIAKSHGWSTTATPPRAISDVFPFAQKGVPVLFPIPGQRWRGYSTEERAAAMRRFDHYHQPADEYDPAFPLTGTRHFADWLWAMVKAASEWQ
jgi:Zn-dependent M28 family amino/carboxypeptidase